MAYGRSHVPLYLPRAQDAAFQVAFTVLGPSTRVMISSPAVNLVLETLSEKGRPWTQNRPDSRLAKRLAEYPEVAIELGQVIQFSWNQRASLVHSEPDSTGLHRGFVSVLLEMRMRYGLCATSGARSTVPGVDE